MDKKELIRRLRQIQSSVYSIPDQKQKQQEYTSFIVADLMTLIWELEADAENEGTEG